MRYLWCSVVLAVAAPALAGNLSQADCDKLVAQMDQRQESGGDMELEALVVMKDTGKEPLAYDVRSFRRSASGSSVILIEKPKLAAGQGYLRVDKNTWYYDPTVGRWERRTERDKIAGTGLRRPDMDNPRYVELYNATCEGEEMLSKVKVQKILLKAKPGQDPVFPINKIWVDANLNPVKQENYSLSNKLERTVYFLKWQKEFSETKKGDVWYPGEAHIFDELQKGFETHSTIRKVKTAQLPDSVFTKAYLESKSR